MKGFFPWFLNKHNIQSYKLKTTSYQMYILHVCVAKQAKQSKAKQAMHVPTISCMHAYMRAYMHAAGHPGGGFVKKGGEVGRV